MAIQTREHFDANNLEVSIKSAVVTKYGAAVSVVELHGELTTPSGRHCKFNAFAHVPAGAAGLVAAQIKNDYRALRLCAVTRDLEVKTYRDESPPISSLQIAGLAFSPSPAY